MPTKPSTRAERLTARAVIGLFIVFALVVMMFPSASIGAMVDALQQTNSPTASDSGSPSGSPTDGQTSTPSPTPTDVRPIQFLNPSSHSTVVSTKDDDTNTTYHLVAVVRSVPANPIVEFKYQQGESAEVSIGIATRVGTTDTFHMQWAAGSLADGAYTLKAVLYNGAIEIGRDEQEVTVNNADDFPNDPQAETVEIVAPPTGAPAGFFQPAGQPTAHTIIDVTSSDALAPPSASLGTSVVTGYYTKTPIGSEPEWIECGTGGAEGPDDPPTSIRCTLAEGDTHPQVTALAAVATAQIAAPPPPAPAPEIVPGSGDAHRVFPYAQIPSSVAFDPATQTGKPAGACADPVVATVRDQNNNKIAGVNVDVHAKGPSDNVFFDTTNQDASQPPDRAHTAPEAAWDCAAGAEGGEQGQHEFAPGNPDTKHIESVTGTTNENGSFTFQLYSADPGTTQFALWGDIDDDDQWCVNEESSRGSIGWTATASPSPTGSASPTQSSSPTSTPTAASPRPTQTQEPTQLEPEVTNCPRPGGTATPTQTAPAENRSITLDASRGRVKQGRRVQLSGRITADNPQCANNEVVEIERRLHGTNNFQPWRTTATDDNGDYSVRTRPKRGADYQAVAPAQGACDEATSSPPDSVRVRPSVTIGASRYRNVPRGADVRIDGRVRPAHDGDRVILQRKKGKRWVRVDADRLNRNSRYRFNVEATWNEGRRFRVIWPKQDQDHIKGKSRAIRIRIRG